MASAIADARPNCKNPDKPCHAPFFAWRGLHGIVPSLYLTYEPSLARAAQAVNRKWVAPSFALSTILPPVGSPGRSKRLSISNSDARGSRPRLACPTGTEVLIVNKPPAIAFDSKHPFAVGQSDYLQVPALKRGIDSFNSQSLTSNRFHRFWHLSPRFSI